VLDVINDLLRLVVASYGELSGREVPAPSWFEQVEPAAAAKAALGDWRNGMLACAEPPGAKWPGDIGLAHNA
jgi:hypothetical protein